MAARGIWNTPGLRDFVRACLAEDKSNGEIRGLIKEQLGIAVTPCSLWNVVNRLKSSFQTQSLANLLTPPNGYAQPVASPGPLHSHAKGWEPRVELSGDEGVAVTDVLDSEKTIDDEDELIRGWGLSPAEWRIIPPLTVNRWQTTLKVGSGENTEVIQKWNFQFRAKLVKRDKHPDLAPLIAEIAKHKKPKSSATQVGSRGTSLVACWSDTQAGKGDGDGAEGTVARCLEKIDLLEDYVKRLRRHGAQIGTLYIFGMGDLIEGCDSHYAQQTFRTELNLRDQVKVMRRLIAKAIERWAPLFERVVVGCVGGNHGENRRDGKSFTDFADNHDVAIFDQLAEAFSYNAEAFGHVSFRIPKDELSLTFDVSGVVVGITHGHVAGKSSSVGLPQKKLLDWWMKQAHGMQPVGDATILISGHYHHFSVIEAGRKTHIQCPALEGGSDWWRNMTGQQARPGLLTMIVGKDVSPAGYRSIEVL